jgi:hypothetical protein
MWADILSQKEHKELGGGMFIGRNSNAALELKFVIRHVLSRVIWTGKARRG